MKDMAAPYGGSHDGRKDITPHYGCDKLTSINNQQNLCKSSIYYEPIIATKGGWVLPSLPKI